MKVGLELPIELYDEIERLMNLKAIIKILNKQVIDIENSLKKHMKNEPIAHCKEYELLYSPISEIVFDEIALKEERAETYNAFLKKQIIKRFVVEKVEEV